MAIFSNEFKANVKKFFTVDTKAVKEKFKREKKTNPLELRLQEMQEKIESLENDLTARVLDNVLDEINLDDLAEKAVKKIDTDEMLDELKRDMDPEELARHVRIDYHELSCELDLSELDLDYDRIANNIDIDEEELADQLCKTYDASEVAGHLDCEEIAEHIRLDDNAYEEIAMNLNLAELAKNIDPRQMLDALIDLLVAQRSEIHQLKVVKQEKKEEVNANS